MSKIKLDLELILQTLLKKVQEMKKKASCFNVRRQTEGQEMDDNAESDKKKDEKLQVVKSPSVFNDRGQEEEEEMDDNKLSDMANGDRTVGYLSGIIYWVYEKIMELTTYLLEQLFLFVKSVILRIVGPVVDAVEAFLTDSRVQYAALDALVEFLTKRLGFQLAIN
ncbi:uncharacterized protein [Drosophila takahashii]|uniref:uncharacterized protein n=1 Tax=Drosophila takahashii TaxID=29030 RepID=UPI0038994061